MPSILTTFKESGAVDIGLEEEEVDLAGGSNCENMSKNKSDENERRQTGMDTVFAEVSIHEPPKETCVYETVL